MHQTELPLRAEKTELMPRRLAIFAHGSVRILAYGSVALLLCLFAFSGDAFAQGGQLQPERPQLKRTKPLTPAQRRALREDELRKLQEEEALKTEQAKAEDEAAKKKLTAEEAAKKKTAAERERANRLYTEPLIKPLPGQRTIGAPVNRPGDKPQTYRFDTHAGMGAPGAWGSTSTLGRPAPILPAVKRGRLPMEANQTLLLIRSGGPFPYPAKDGSTFQNREKQLPDKPRGYYREYTVPTAGAPDRGARRIIVGRGGEMYYTDNHYRSFKLVVN
jgi:ribonuclease T1